MRLATLPHRNTITKSISQFSAETCSVHDGPKAVSLNQVDWQVEPATARWLLGQIGQMNSRGKCSHSLHIDPHPANSPVCFQALVHTLVMFLRNGHDCCWREWNRSVPIPQISESYEGNETDWREGLIDQNYFSLTSLVRWIKSGNYTVVRIMLSTCSPLWAGSIWHRSREISLSEN